MDSEVEALRLLTLILSPVVSEADMEALVVDFLVAVPALAQAVAFPAPQQMLGLVDLVVDLADKACFLIMDPSEFLLLINNQIINNSHFQLI